MNCTCNVTSKLISPGHYNLKQFTNGTDTMTWKISCRFCNGNSTDLNDYDAFLVLQKRDGEIDEVALSKTLNDDNSITLTWSVGTYATWLTESVKYQIVFRGSCLSGLGVIGCSTVAANGSYSIDNELAEGHGRSWTNDTTNTYKITWDTSNNRWQLKNGDTLIDYQTFANAEPCCGQWGNIGVANATACVWTSLEAVMYVSDSIAADEHVTAKSATILRQMWWGLRNIVIKSGVNVSETAIAQNDWTASGNIFTLDVTNKLELPEGITISEVRLFKDVSGVKKEIANFCVNKDAENSNISISSLEKVTGSIIVTTKGGNGYFVNSETLDISSAALAGKADVSDVEALESNIGTISNALGDIEGE